MINKTTESAIKVLIYLVLQDSQRPVSIRRIAQSLRLSRPYQSKVVSMLVKANLLIAHHGSMGGVLLSRPASAITLFEVIEVCQGRLLGDYCVEYADLKLTCAFHQAMKEAHDALLKVLSRWTLADLAAKPGPSGSLIGQVSCRMAIAYLTEMGVSTNGRTVRTQ